VEDGENQLSAVSSSCSSSQRLTIKPNSIALYIKYVMLANTPEYVNGFQEWDSGQKLAAIVAERRGMPIRLMAQMDTGDEAAVVRAQWLWECRERAGWRRLEDSVSPAWVAKLPLQLRELTSDTRRSFVRAQAAAVARVTPEVKLGHLGLRLQEGGPLVAEPCLLMREVGGCRGVPASVVLLAGLAHAF
jgi:hypothetical protein